MISEQIRQDYIASEEWFEEKVELFKTIMEMDFIEALRSSTRTKHYLECGAQNDTLWKMLREHFEERAEAKARSWRESELRR